MNNVNGKGVLFTAENKTVYTGSFKDDKPHGLGKVQYADGSCYIGAFQQGAMTGMCKFIFSDGGFYEGGVVDGVASGQGKYTYQDPSKVYEGEFLNNKKHGHGVLKMKKYHFTGAFKDGKIHGAGEMTWTSGIRLVGNFHYNQPHGDMTQYDKDGKPLKVTYKMGKLQRDQLSPKNNTTA